MNARLLFRRKRKPPVCSAVIVAAGSSQRMGTDKIMMKLGAMPVLARTILAFENSEYVDEIIIVTRTEKLEEIAKLCHDNGLHKVKQVVSGGATRMESALAGVSACRHEAELIAIHDGARPLLTQALIERTRIYAARNTAPPSRRPEHRHAQDRGRQGLHRRYGDRASTVRVQTPQVFDADLIKGALTKAVELNLPLTDDCSAMDMMGVKTFVVEGEAENIKITTPSDYVTAKAIVEDRNDWNANRTWV